ncbi:ATP-dependent DNA ligase [Candidatus Gracilibacteria bacterium]|nr:ATP-dependent DNA ligase [Candidatus Gracilibacteria bacterium]
MHAFAELFTALDETTRTNDKIAALVRYFAVAPPNDAAWALYFLMGRRPRQVVNSRKLAEWALRRRGMPLWLFGECYDAVGDLAETIALIVGTGSQPMPTVSTPATLSGWITERLLPLRDLDETQQRALLHESWAALNIQERFLWNKLITGGFRVGVSQRLVTRALAQVSGVDDAVIAHRLMGDWQPDAAFYTRLLAAETDDDDLSRPYPFCLAYPLESEPAALGPIADWQAEWKWDGIRAQLIRRGEQVFLWSRGEELVTERFPELAACGELLPDGTAIDGEILPYREGAVLPFAQLQRRIGRKTLGRKLLAEVPVVLFAYDLLEHAGQDIRDRPLNERRALLAQLIASLTTKGPQGALLATEDTKSTKTELENLTDLSEAGAPSEVAPPIGTESEKSAVPLYFSPIVTAESWEVLRTERERSRELSAEGLMLKRLGAPYRVGRVRGDWWKWKIAPYTVDAVLIYAQRGSGKRASLYTDYTFGIWDGDVLVPFAKAYSGLTDAEIRRVDAFVRRNTTEKFGPVRTVTRQLVFELAFEGIQRSSRHKSGIAVRFPRILRWREDKTIHDADTLATVQALIPNEV